MTEIKVERLNVIYITDVDEPDKIPEIIDCVRATNNRKNFEKKVIEL